MSSSQSDIPAHGTRLSEEKMGVTSQDMIHYRIIVLCAKQGKLPSETSSNTFQSNSVISKRSTGNIWLFLLGVIIGGYLIPIITEFLDISQPDAQARARRGDVPSSHSYVPLWAERGTVGGTVWTAPGSLWGDAETLVGPWPPQSQGKAARFLKWTGYVREGHLIMRQDNRNDVRGSVEGVQRVAPVDVRISMAGAVIDLLPEATKEKSKWLRKVPIRIVFPDARDPYTEVSFVLFANTASEKEQWYLALSWAAEFFVPSTSSLGLHTIGLHAQHMYAQFCSYMRNVAPVILPVAMQHKESQLHLFGSQSSRSGAAERGTKRVVPNRGWFGIRRKRRLPPRAQTPPPQAHHRSQVVGDFIKDKQWGGKTSQALRGNFKGAGEGATSVKGQLPGSHSSSAPSLTSLAARSPLVSTALPPSKETSIVRQGSMPSRAGSVLGETAVADDPVNHVASSNSLKSDNTAFTQGGLSTTWTSPKEDTTPPGASEAPTNNQHVLHAGHGAGQLAGLHAINMFIVRIAFDMLRSQRFYDYFRQRVTTRLASINVPNYITPLRVDGMELGTTTPLIKSAYTLPSPDNVLVPRLVLDIVYKGSFKLIVQTSINMKDTAAIGSDIMGSVNTPPLYESPPPPPDGMLDAAALNALQNCIDNERAGNQCKNRQCPEESQNGAVAVNGKPNRKAGLALRGYRSIRNIMSGGAPASLVDGDGKSLIPPCTCQSCCCCRC